jgi:carbon monoxide dehydrogenase subunit G|tara:strand:+ start:85430 stop:86062 length:633 start_codon:yes stop_codon:yes gene_type:complete
VELIGKQVIQLPRAQVWEALNDPEVLKQCIPGCDQFVASGENEYDIVMTAAVGPIKAKFKGKLTLGDINPPESYTLTFDGSGGAAGFGKGNASVVLGDLPGQTELEYSVQAKVGGRLAQVGSRLIDGVAKKMADEFFERFKQRVEPEGAGEGEASGAGASNNAAQPTEDAASKGQAAGRDSGGKQPSMQQRWIWYAIAALIIVLVLGYST